MNKHRFALLMMMGAYPMVVAILHALPSAVMHQPHWIKALLMVPVMVLWMFYVVSPLIQRHFRSWLAPKQAPTSRN